MKKVIFNADDYGRTQDISRGIREAHLNGVVTSTTCMMNIPTTAEDIALALSETPNLDLGVHLVLTMGRPLSESAQVTSVVDENGNFFKYTPFIDNLSKLDAAQVKEEWRKQVERFVQAAGRKPSHLDSHHHSSYFSPLLFREMLELAKEYDTTIRFPFVPRVSSEVEETAKQVPELMQHFPIRHPDAFFADFYDEHANYGTLMDIFARLPEGISEIMCHPGYVDAAFAEESSYNYQREQELRILIDPALTQAIHNAGVELTSFATV